MVRGHGPTPAERPLVEAIANTPMSREEATLTIGVLAVAIFGAYEAIIGVANNVVTNELDKNTETVFETVEGTGVEPKPEGEPDVNPILVFGGLGMPQSVADGIHIGKHMLGSAER